jgi:hypothetical protein
MQCWRNIIKTRHAEIFSVPHPIGSRNAKPLCILIALRVGC